MADSIFQGLDLFETHNLGYSQFIASALSFDLLASEKRLAIFFRIADIDRDERLSLADFERFMAIQFKYRPAVSNKFRVSVIHQFAGSGLAGKDFAGFRAGFSRD